MKQLCNYTKDLQKSNLNHKDTDVFYIYKTFYVKYLTEYIVQNFI